MSEITYNNFKDTTIRGVFNNSDYPDSSVLASATFDRNVTIKGNLYLGQDASGGNIYVWNGGTQHTITPADLINGGGGSGGTGFPAFIDQLSEFYDQIG